MDITDEVGELLVNKQSNKEMKNGFGKLTCENWNSAIVYGVLADCLYILGAGNVFTLDWHQLVNVFVLAFLTSIVKNLSTDNHGDFAGTISVIPDKK